MSFYCALTAEFRAGDGCAAVHRNGVFAAGLDWRFGSTWDWHLAFYHSSAIAKRGVEIGGTSSGGVASIEAPGQSLPCNLEITT